MTGIYTIDSIKRNASGCSGPQVTSKPDEPYVAVQAMRVQKHIQAWLRPCPDVKTCLQWAADPWNARGSKGVPKQPRAVYNTKAKDGALAGHAPVVGRWDEKANLCVGAEVAVSTVRVGAEGKLRAEKRVHRFDAPAAGPEEPRCRTGNLQKAEYEKPCAIRHALLATRVKPVPACAKADCTNTAK